MKLNIEQAMHRNDKIVLFFPGLNELHHQISYRISKVDRFHFQIIRQNNHNEYGKKEEKRNKGKYMIHMVRHAPYIKHKHSQIIDFALGRFDVEPKPPKQERRMKNEAHGPSIRSLLFRARGLLKYINDERPTDRHNNDFEDECDDILIQYFSLDICFFSSFLQLSVWYRLFFFLLVLSLVVMMEKKNCGYRIVCLHYYYLLILQHK